MEEQKSPPLRAQVGLRISLLAFEKEHYMERIDFGNVWYVVRTNSIHTAGYLLAFI